MIHTKKEITYFTDLLKQSERKYPFNPCVEDAVRKLTYRELLNESRQLAYSIADKIDHGDRVLCFTEKNVEFVIVFLAVILAGGTPILIDCNDQNTITSQKIDYLSPALVIFISSLEITQLFDANKIFKYKDLLEAKKTATEVLPEPAEICYMLLTSGTTGEPKAVQISHQNVLHYIFAVHERLDFPRKLNSAHVTTFAADLGLTNFLVSLVSGGNMRIFDRSDARDSIRFLQLIKQADVSFLKTTPSHLLSIIGAVNTSYEPILEYLVLGGEKLTWNDADFIRNSNICRNLFNHYGPTETTIGVTMFDVWKNEQYKEFTASVPIGSPLGNNVGIIDTEDGKLGELLISGPGVGLGYFKLEDTNKFGNLLLNGTRINCYRTGDYCKALSDGNYEFLYRIDNQVKIRGYRVELGEIEVALLSHPAIKMAFVTYQEDDGNTCLEAFVNVRDGKSLTASELYKWLKGEIAEYKVPSHMHFFTELITTKNGKIDKKAIQSQFEKKSERSAKLSFSNAQNWSDVVNVAWRKTLLIDEIDMSEDFFSLGANSIHAIKLIASIQRQGYDVTINDLYETPNFKDFIGLNRSKAKRNLASPFAKNELTFSQKSFLKSNFNLDKYCQTVLFEASQKIQIREFGLALKTVFLSHEVLTRKFNSGLDIGNNYKYWELTFSFLSDDMPHGYQIYDKCEEIISTISIEEGKTFFVHVFIDEENDVDYVFIAAHHMVVDVISWTILFEEIVECYDQIVEGITPNIPLESLINDFYSKTEGNSKEQVFEMDTAAVLKGNQVAEGFEAQKLVFSNTLGNRLLAFEKENTASTLEGYLFYAFASSLLSSIEKPKILVDVEFHGRLRSNSSPDISRSVGWWANSIPLELSDVGMSAEMYTQLLAKMSDKSGEINLNRKIRKGEKSNVRFNYLGKFPESYKGNSLELTPSLLNIVETRSLEAEGEYEVNFTVRFVGSYMVVDIQTAQGSNVIKNPSSVVTAFTDILRQDFPSIEQEIISSYFEGNMPSVGKPIIVGSEEIKGIPALESPVLVTGGTGFLGLNLIRELVHSGYDSIYVLVREQDAYAKKRFDSLLSHYEIELKDEELERIHLITGDLRKDFLGMGRDVYDLLKQSVKIVFHAAADINLTNSYEALKSVNIEGTKRIVDFCKAGIEKSLHYVSTLAVAGYLKRPSEIIFSEKDFEIGQLFKSNYEQSKFDAEKVIREYMSSGQEVVIHRMGHIAGNSITGKFQKNIGTNRVMQILKGIIELKMVPENYNESISFSYVDVVAKSMVAIAHLESKKSCYHLESPYYIGVQQILNMLNELGYGIKRVPYVTFIEAVEANENNESVILLYNWVKRHSKSASSVKIVSNQTNDLLIKIGLFFRKADSKWFKKLIDNGVESGFFSAPVEEVEYARIELM